MSNTTKKTTKKQNFEALLKIEAVIARPDLVEFINKQIATLDKRSTNEDGTKKLTPEQEANEALKEEIADILANSGNPMTVSNICKKFAEQGKDYSNQKISGLLRYMGKDGVVKRLEEKRVTYFALA